MMQLNISTSEIVLLLITNDTYIQCRYTGFSHNHATYVCNAG